MTQLSKSVNNKQLAELIKSNKKVEIADFIFERFSERYILPIKNLNSKDRHGFSIMAVSCLMIESLESFKQGYLDTKNKSRKAFTDFLSNEPEFIDFNGYENDFYENVRCGILHQSETTNGWKIKRKGLVFDHQTKTINASIFLDKLEKTLQKYTDSLKQQNLNNTIWINLFKKLNSIISNC